MTSRPADIVKRLAAVGGAFCITIGACAGPTRAADTFYDTPIQQLDFGVICDYLPQGTDVTAPETNAGKVRQGGTPVVFDITTDIVPARIGVAFGIRMLAEESAGRRTVTMVTRHPSFGPGYLDQESWPSQITGGVPSARYFVFEFDYEMTPGSWQMDVLLDGRLIASKAFTVVDPAMMPNAPDPCPGAAQIS